MFQILIVAHEPFASATLESLRRIMGEPLPVHALDIAPDDPPQQAQQRLKERIEGLRPDGDILILVDFLGGTPSNIVLPYLQPGETEVITGFNMPLVFKATRLATNGRELNRAVPELTRYGASHIQRAAELLAE